RRSRFRPYHPHLHVSHRRTSPARGKGERGGTDHPGALTDFLRQGIDNAAGGTDFPARPCCMTRAEPRVPVLFRRTKKPSPSDAEGVCRLGKGAKRHTPSRAALFWRFSHFI